MKDRSIIFNAQMVRAILEGRKTHTRRVVKPQPTKSGPYSKNYARWEYIWLWDIGSWGDGEQVPVSMAEYCPYGQPGDQLWVREAFRILPMELEYRADNAIRSLDFGELFDVLPLPDDEKWRPSIHMPRWASRIDLEITGVRAERVQDISEEDARAEGVIPRNTPIGALYRPEFQELWDSINTNPGYTWQDNPLVWVIEFVRLGK